MATWTQAGVTYFTQKDAIINYIKRTGYGSTSAGTLNSQPALAAVTKTRLAEGEPIPIVYGHAQVGGLIFSVDYDEAAGLWTVAYIACMGEIESIQAVYIDEAAITAGVEVNELNTYVGLPNQAADPLLAAAIPGYTDRLRIEDPVEGFIGVAYVVIQYTDAQYNDFPDVVIEVEGRKVYNPATGTTVYSTNPALHLGDLLSNSVYGLGRTVNAASLTATAAACDTLIDGEAQFQGYTVIATPQALTSWVDILRTYAGCFLAYRGDEVVLIADRAQASTASIAAEDIEAGSLKISKKDSSDIPTVIEATYTDKSNTIWREILCDPAKSAGVDAGTTPTRMSRIQLPGVDRHSQAHRMCITRLNQLVLSDTTFEWVQFDEALNRELGEVVQLTNPLGIGNKAVRLTREPEMVGPGRWLMVGEEYDAAAYSNVVVDTPSTPDTNLPRHVVPAVVENVVAVEEIYQTLDYLYHSRIRVTWDASPGAFITGYIVRVKQSNVLIATVEETGTEAATGPLRENGLYDIEVSAVTPLYTGLPGTTTVTVSGNEDAPDDVTGLGGSNQNGTLHLWWNAVTGIRRYELRYYATNQIWSQGTILDIVDGLSHSSNGIVPDGTWRFGVKALDSAGIASVNADEHDIILAAGTDNITTYYQDNDPTLDGPVVEGSLWYMSSLDNTPFRYDGTNWIQIRDGLIDSKVTTYYSDNDPSLTETLTVGDLWYLGNDQTNPAFRWNGTDWIQVGAGIQTYYTDIEPTITGPVVVGSIWYISSGTINTPFRWDGTVWREVSDGNIAIAQAAADEKAKTFTGTDTPVGMTEGDLWVMPVQITQPPGPSAGASFWVQSRTDGETLNNGNSVSIGSGGSVEGDLPTTTGTPIGVAGQISNPMVKVTSAGSANVVLTLHVEGVASSASITIAPGASGEIIGTGTATVAVGDLVDWRVTTTGTGAVVTMLALAFVPDSATQCVTVTNSNNTGSTNINDPNTDFFFKVGGTRTDRLIEDEVAFEWPIPVTATHYYTSTGTVQKVETITSRLRINSANGNGTVSYAGTGAGQSIFVDETNSDTLADGDIVNYMITNGSDADTLSNNIEKIGFTGISSAFKFLNMYADEYVFDQTDNLTRYYPLGGQAISGGSDTESDVEYTLPFAINASELLCRVVLDVMTSDSYVLLRKNGADVGTIMTVKAAGHYRQALNVDFAAGDTICYKVVTGPTGTRVRWGHFGLVAQQLGGVSPPGETTGYETKTYIDGAWVVTATTTTT